MTSDGTKIKHCKKRGEWAELRFMARAAEHDLCVSKPWGDSARYDFVVEYGGRFVRVQVKSTTYQRRRSYICHLHQEYKHPYNKEQIDFVAAYIIPLDLWFIFPIEVIMNATSNLVLSPHMENSKHGVYMEAWHLLRGERSQLTLS